MQNSKTMKQIVLITFLFLSFRAFSQVDCKFYVRILQNPPTIVAVSAWDHDDEMSISECPELKAEEIADTFMVYHLCVDKGVYVIQAIRPHEQEDEFGFRHGYQIVFWDETAPAELKELTTGDCIFMKIIPFYKANRMPGGLGRPIKLDGVWISLPQYESDNIYHVESSSIYKLTQSDCDCDSRILHLNEFKEAIKEN